TDHGIFKSIYFFDPNGHRLELATDTGTAEELAELKRVAPAMLEEWSHTKKAPQHAAWLHEKARATHAAAKARLGEEDVAQPSECRIRITLALQGDHWRRHDRAFWAQTLATAIDEAAPHRMRVDTYELQDMMLIVHARANRPPKVMKKLLDDD